MTAKVDTSTIAVTGLEASAPADNKSNNTNSEKNLERGDTPYRHRWEYAGTCINSTDIESLVSSDVYKFVVAVVIIALFVLWAIGKMPFGIGLAVGGGILYLLYLKFVFTGSTFKALRKTVLSMDEFFKKMDEVYSADAQLRWDIEWYHTIVYDNTYTSTENGNYNWKTYKKVVTHREEKFLDYYKCNDISVPVSPANIKEGNLYRFFVEKHVQPGDEECEKEKHVPASRLDQSYEVTETLTIPGYKPTFLVTRHPESIPFLLSPFWYIFCNLTIILSFPYEIYFCCKTKVFRIQVVKEFWVYPENHQFQKATCLDDIESRLHETSNSDEQGFNENVVQEASLNANNASTNSGESSHTGGGQTNDGFDDGEMRKAIALSLQENDISQKAQ